MDIEAVTSATSAIEQQDMRNILSIITKVMEDNIQLQHMWLDTKLKNYLKTDVQFGGNIQ